MGFLLILSNVGFYNFANNTPGVCQKYSFHQKQIIGYTKITVSENKLLIGEISNTAPGHLLIQ